MAYVRVESSVPRHRKFLRAGPAASWLWLCGLAYCQEGLTDGFIPFEAVASLGVKSPGKHVAVLVRVGLWDQCDGGWKVHDYLDHNKPADEVRRVQGERRKAGTEGGKASGFARRSTDSGAEAKQVASANAKQTANPSTATSTATATATATAGRTAHTRGQSAPIHSTHIRHAACGRVCVPADLHTEFVASLNRDDADKVLRDWYLEVDHEWSVGSKRSANTGGNGYQFWRARFSEQWPAERGDRTSKTTPKGWDAWKPQQAS